MILPKNAEDVDFVKNQTISISDIINNRKELLRWLQDASWGVFNTVGNILRPNILLFKPDLFRIIMSNDLDWGMNILSFLIIGNAENVDAEIITFMKSLTKTEKRVDILELLEEASEVFGFDVE